MKLYLARALLFACFFSGACLMALSFMSYNRANRLRGSCQSNMRQVSFALQQYSHDYNDKLPLARAANPRDGDLTGQPYTGKPIGWAYQIDHYLKCISCLQCPGDETGSVTFNTGNGFTDYWFNGHLSGVGRFSLRHADAVILLGEGSDGRDKTGAAYSKTALPPLWLKNDGSPLRRHLGGANYLFADGHIAWLRADTIAAKDRMMWK